jgi:hypothetical protein
MAFRICTASFTEVLSRLGCFAGSPAPSKLARQNNPALIAITARINDTFNIAIAPNLRDLNCPANTDSIHAR